MIVFLLVTVGLLLGASVPTMGAGGEYSEKELANLPNDEFQVLNSIGVHFFDLNERGYLESEGYVSLSNTHDKPVSAKLEVITGHLSIVDLDDEGNPRTHKVSDSIYIHPFPKQWITLSEDEIVISANSWYNVHYTVKIPYEEAWEYIEHNTSNGFLAYINVKKGAETTGGMNIGINYNYKVFSIFSGEYQEPTITMSFYFFAGIISIIGGLVSYLVYDKVEKRKRLGD